LKALIEDATIDEFVRHSALNALAYLTYRGDIAPQATRDYLRWLHHAMQPREENFAFVGIVDAIANLGFLEHPAFRWNHLKADKMLEIQKDRASFKRKTAHTFAHDALREAPGFQ
jgi:hypothetical protein